MGKLRRKTRALYRPMQRTHMRSLTSSFVHKKVGIGETVASDDAERFFEPPSNNDGDYDDDDEHEKDIFFVVPKHNTLDCVPGDDFVDENVDVDAELYATKVRNDAL